MKFKEYLKENENVIKDFEKEIRNKYGLTHFNLFTNKKDLILDMIVVPKDKRKQGIGSKVLKEICDYADRNDLRILLTTNTKDDVHGTTSSDRLKKFYKRFGFVENKGRNKDFTTSHNMIRDVKKVNKNFNEDLQIDVFPTCLNECKNNFDYLIERVEHGIDKKFVSEKEVPGFGYVIRKEIWKILNDKSDSGTEIESAYTKDGDYMGNVKTAKFLTEKKGITKFEKRTRTSSVVSIGFNEKEKKWFGWSHRAICGFGIGDKVFEEDFGDGKTPFVKHGSKTIKNLEQAKEAAKNFAAYVS